MRKIFTTMIIFAFVAILVLPQKATADSGPFVGEIRIFTGAFAPKGWLFCNGQLLSISQNKVLFSIIGTTYGGDGKTTFALPDLRNKLSMSGSVSYQHPSGKSWVNRSGAKIRRPTKASTKPSSLNYIIALEGVFPYKT